jgi:hypothetical protein
MLLLHDPPKQRSDLMEAPQRPAGGVARISQVPFAEELVAPPVIQQAVLESPAPVVPLAVHEVDEELLGGDTSYLHLD